MPMSPDTHSHMNTLPVAKTLTQAQRMDPQAPQERLRAAQPHRQADTGQQEACSPETTQRPSGQVSERLGAVGSDAERDSE